MKRASIIVPVMVVGLQTAALAQVTPINVPELLNQRLAAHGPFPHNVSYEDTESYQACSHGPPRSEGEEHCTTRSRKIIKTRVENAVLTVGDVSITQIGDPESGAVAYKSLPTEYVEDAQDFPNCSSISLNASMSLQISHQRSTQVTLTDAIANNISATAKGSVSIFSTGVELTVTVSQNRTVTTAKMDATTATNTQTRQGTFVVKPKSRVIALMDAYRIRGEMPFKFTFLADGPLPPNNAGLVKLSDILSVSDRTVVVGGVLISDDISKGQTKLLDSSLKTINCNAPPLPGEHFVIPNGYKLYYSKIKLKSPA